MRSNALAIRRLKLATVAQAEAETKLASRSSELTQMTAQHEAVAHQLEAMSSRYVHQTAQISSFIETERLAMVPSCIVAD